MGSSRTRVLYWLALTILAIGIIIATAGAWQRASNIDAGQAVAIMVDFNRLERVAFIERMPLDEAVRDLLQAGVDGFVVRERTLAELEVVGRVRVAWGWELLDQLRSRGKIPPPSLQPMDVYIFAIDPVLEDWLYQRLQRRWRHGKISLVEVENSPWIQVALSRPDPLPGQRPSVPLYADDYSGPFPRDLMMLPLGVEAAAVDQLVRWGALVGAEINGRPLEGFPDEWAHGLEPLPPGSLMVFKDGVVPAPVDDVAGRIQEGGWRLGLVWSQTSSLLQQAAAALSGNLVKIHPMWPGEPLTAIVRGVEERYERVVYYQRFVTLQPGSVASLTPDLITSVRQSLRSAGFEPGSPASLQAASVSSWIRGGSLLTLVGVWLMLSAVIRGTRIWRLPLSVLSALLILGLIGTVAAIRFVTLWSGSDEIGWRLAALFVSIVFPVLGILGAVNLVRYLKFRPNQVAGNDSSIVPLVAGFCGLLVSTAITVAGGLVVQALLGTEMYTTQQLQFLGVRPSLILPALLLALWKLGDGQVNWRRMITLMDRPLRWGHIAVVGVVLVVVALVLMRSGNFPIIPVPELELKLRAWLDMALGVRPRTKEFAFGHPLLLVALAGLAMVDNKNTEAARRSIWSWLLPCGAIGQASVINTFAHLHTPLLISLLRTWNGVWLGGLLGVALWLGCWHLYKNGRYWLPAMARAGIFAHADDGKERVDYAGASR